MYKQQEWLASLWCGMSAEQWSARDLVNNYYRINYELSRKKWKNNFEYFIKGMDLLNLTGSVIGSTEVNPAYLQTTELDAFPGQILIGIKWYIGSSGK